MQFVDRAGSAGIDFSNDLFYTEDFNPYTYKSFFNGGGVALGDVNNDGLLDIYLTGNLVDNKLYLNRGNWQFEDITEKAGVACKGVWSSGATFADIDGDGLLDLYVCKSGKPEGGIRHNELFINNGDLTFSEEARTYGLDIEGLSTHAAFFDYDKDGDLDAYVLTNSIKSVGGYDLIVGQREIPDPLNGGNKFLVNYDGKYYDSTSYKGIYTSEIGFGLGITLSDFNGDSWTDVFISNDFFERDYLYLNDEGKGFVESLEAHFGSISMGSMGADAADLNNDALPDLFVTEMLPRSIPNQRTKTIFESWDKQQLAQSKGYFNQFSRNVLQLNTSGFQFLEIGRYSDVSATDWSWGALMFDFDNDGNKDVYVSNGIYKDLLDRDYLTYSANDQEIARILREKGSVITELLNAMPSTPVPNRAFRNNGRLVFQESAASLGLGGVSYSNGSAYGDLDNDGDYDLVVNNVGQVASVYENTVEEFGNGSLSVILKGTAGNSSAIGAKVLAYADSMRWMLENFPSRGFQSSVDSKLIFGMGKEEGIDSLEVFWPDGYYSKVTSIDSNVVVIEYDAVQKSKVTSDVNPENQQMEVRSQFSNLRHTENNFVDFDRDRLLPIMLHNEGPGLVLHDFDKNGNLEVVLGGAKGFPTKIANLSDELKLSTIDSISFEKDKVSEDIKVMVADFNGDLWDDLLITSGGRAVSTSSNALLDRVYLNNGKGGFVRKRDAIPYDLKFSTGASVVGDFDDDGDVDIFMAERFHPFYYGQDCRWAVLLNDGSGKFSDESDTWIKSEPVKYMATDAVTMDYNQDGVLDIAVSTDWGPIVVLEGSKAGFSNVTEEVGMSATGWWSAIEAVDIDFDGDIDLLAGNHGTNSFFKDGMRVYIKDFDQNGTVEHIYCIQSEGKYYPIADRNELVAQLPGLKKRILYFRDYAEMDITQVFTENELKGARVLEAGTLSSTVYELKEGSFKASALPWELQISPIHDFKVVEQSRDQLMVFVGGNQYLVKPQFGRFDALPLSIWYLQKDATNMVRQTDLFSQVRDIEVVTVKGRSYVFTASTNDEVRVFQYE
ncbi:MAG: VCBS repeat-containing protein [Cyclobacteriaceae bacterium]